MAEIETRSFEQLPEATSLSPDDIITMQSPSGPAKKIKVGQAFALFQNCDIALETVADLTTDAAAIALPVQSLAVVYANPDATQSGYWLKTSAAGSGTWALTDIQYGYSAAYADQAKGARDAAAAFANFVPGTREAAEAVTEVGGLFSIADAGTVVAYVRTEAGSDELARVATQAEMLARARTAISRVALAALPAPVLGQTAILAEGRREGVFTAVAYAGVADLVAADPEQGIMVRSTADPAIVWRRQYAGELDIRWFGGLPNAIVTSNGTVTQGTSCHTAFAAARAFGVATGKPFTVLFAGGDYYTSASLKMVGDMTLIVADGHLFGKFVSPAGAGLGHHNLAVVTAAGSEPGSPALGTGDYFETAPRPFANGSVIAAGARSFVAGAGQAADLANGSVIGIWMGQAGWHGFFSEMIEVAGVAGDVATTKTQLRFAYDNLTTGLGAFCKRFKRAKKAPGNVDNRNWPSAGFRKLQPIRRVKIVCRNGGSIVNLTPPVAGYAVFAVFAWLAWDIEFEGPTKGGGMWYLDCQDVKLIRPKVLAPYSSATANDASRSILVNGSNNVLIYEPELTNCNIGIEEYVDTVSIVRPTIDNGLVYIYAGARNWLVDGPANVTGVDGSRAIQIGSGDYEFGVGAGTIRGVRASSIGATLLFSTPKLLQAHPQIDLQMIPAVEKYFRGDQVLLENCQFYSRDQNGAIMFNTQRIRCNNVQIGTDSNSDIATPVGTAAVIGTLRRAFDGERVGVRRYVGSSPTFFGELGDEAFKSDGTGRKTVIYAKTKMNGILAAPSSGKLQIDAFAADGGYAVGDVITFIINAGGNTTLVLHDVTANQGSPIITVSSTAGINVGMAVTGEMIPVGAKVLTVDSGTQITLDANATSTVVPSQGVQIVVGSIKAEHEAVVTAVDPGASELDYNPAPPPGYIPWLASYGGGGYIKNCRWA